MAVNKSTAVKVVDQSTNKKSENPSKNDDHSSQTVVLKRNPSIGPVTMLSQRLLLRHTDHLVIALNLHLLAIKRPL
ncbi:hypothetical protein [Lactiplantibacillus plantarum]|uniref:hypothetical protein n=1 Tax=Lactiplantibacillus plantarum TaxID=1590 RepID=UPI0012FE1CE1|nr:hypothetical protein [Lactiplantibacillus plantarum]